MSAEHPRGTTRSTTVLINRLSAMRHRFEFFETSQKLALIETLLDRPIRRPTDIRKLYDTLCYLRACPDSDAIYQKATQLHDLICAKLSRLPAAVLRRLHDSGLPHTEVRYEYSHAVARRLCAAFPADLRIDWQRCDDTDKLDGILTRMIADAETQTFDDGQMETRQWVRRAMGDRTESDLAWLIRQLDACRLSARERTALFDAASIQVTWRLKAGRGAQIESLSTRSFPYLHTSGLLRHPASPRRAILRPMRGIRLASPTQADIWILAAVSALATRHREVHAMTYANRDEVYVADAGRGTQIVIYGVLPMHRLTLEGNYGYMIFKNRLAVAYGGASPLFRQANTGINVFPEYRKGEAAWMFVQTLRAFRTLFGCERFIANPYQFGDENEEAIDSAAFWFYYRLGFRPIRADIRRLADVEWKRLRSRPGAQTRAATLKRLATCDLVLSLPAAKAGALYPETNLGLCAAAVTDRLAEYRMPLRQQAIQRCIEETAHRLSVRGRRRWPAVDREGFDRLAPLVALIDNLPRWTTAQRRELVALMRTKNHPREREYVRRLLRCDNLRRALCDFCRRSRRSRGYSPGRSH